MNVKHSHYYKNVAHLKHIDVYRVLGLFNVTDPCIQHAVKKLLVAGGRGAGKDVERDVREAVDSLNRFLQMIAEDDNAPGTLRPCDLVKRAAAPMPMPMPMPMPNNPALTGMLTETLRDTSYGADQSASAAAHGVDLTRLHAAEVLVSGSQKGLSNG